MTGPVVDGYEELAEIGKGAFSRVYSAHQTKIGRQVAVKVLDIGLTGAERTNFEREARVMGRVSTHHHIVTVLDTAFSTSGQPCIVMELYSGGSLADRIRAVGKLNPAEVIDTGIAIASALDTSHEAGVLHCDLKPQNILISDFGQPALGDFGISTLAEERTRTGSGIGFTLHYAAPEVIEGGSPTAASDIYSLAATLYTALAGRRPFEGPTGKRQTSGELARRVLLETPASLVDAGVPAQLDKILARALSKDVSDRQGSAAEFAEALYRCGRGLNLSPIAPTTIGWTRGPEPGSPPDQLRLERDLTEVGGLEPAPVSPFAAPVDTWAPDAPAETVNQPGGHPAPAAPGGPPKPAEPQPVAQAGPDPAVATAPPAVSDEHDSTRAAAPVPTQLHQIEPGPEPAEPATAGRRTRSMLLGGAAVVVAVLGAFFITQRGGSDPVAAPTPTPRPQSAVAVDPVFAPEAPAGIEIDREGPTSILVSWSIEDPDPSVTYEVRRSDDGGRSVVVVDEPPAQVMGVATADRPCVTVLALRANRVSPPSETVCLAAQDSPVVQALDPAGDAFSVGVDGFADLSGAEVAVYDADGTDLIESGWTVRVESQSGLPFGVVLIPPDGETVVGKFLVEVRGNDDSASSWVEFVDSDG